MRWKALANPLLIASVEGLPKIGEVFNSANDINLSEAHLKEMEKKGILPKGKG